jgi:hypothetical protein
MMEMSEVVGLVIDSGISALSLLLMYRLSMACIERNGDESDAT